MNVASIPSTIANARVAAGLEHDEQWVLGSVTHHPTGFLVDEEFSWHFESFKILLGLHPRRRHQA